MVLKFPFVTCVINQLLAAPELTREHNAILRVKHEKIYIIQVIYHTNSYFLVILVFGINRKAITPALGYLH